MMVRGMIVRHLVLPAGKQDSKNVIRYLYDTYGDDIYMSIMSQYTPMPDLPMAADSARIIPNLAAGCAAKIMMRLSITR